MALDITGNLEELNGWKNWIWPYSKWQKS
jgi:hypothetical protein